MGQLGCHQIVLVRRGRVCQEHHQQLPLLQILACVNVHPLISSAVEAAKEDLYEVLEEVNLPTINLAMRS